eukprot:2075286-Rhodomonas_salina.2
MVSINGGTASINGGRPARQYASQRPYCDGGEGRLIAACVVAAYAVGQYRTSRSTLVGRAPASAGHTTARARQQPHEKTRACSIRMCLSVEK